MAAVTFPERSGASVACHGESQAADSDADQSGAPAWLAAPTMAMVLGVLSFVLAALYVVTAGLVRQLTVLNVGPTCLPMMIYASRGAVDLRGPVGRRVRRHLRSHRPGGGRPRRSP